MNNENIENKIKEEYSTTENQESSNQKGSGFAYLPHYISRQIKSAYQRFINNQERRKIRRMSPENRSEYFFKQHEKDYDT